ncbi:hypothetical protein ACFUYE_05365 [Micromonospora humida]|uniref:hypothetical protein n=1 Tax=Micromonospora humida TaxID=2809018 RepID=UPI0036711D97
MTDVVNECVTVTTPVAGLTACGLMNITSLVAFATAFAVVVAGFPAGVVPESDTVTLSGDAPALMTTRYAPRVPRSAAAIVSEDDTAVGDQATPAAVGRVAVSSAMRRTS